VRVRRESSSRTLRAPLSLSLTIMRKTVNTAAIDL